LRQVWLVAAALALAVMFGISGFGKLMGRNSASLAVESVLGISSSQAVFVARFVGVIELGIATAFVFGRIQFGTGAAVLLLLLFTVFLGRLPAGVSCGCFGGGEGPTPPRWFLIGRNLLLMGACGAIGLAAHEFPSGSFIMERAILLPTLVIAVSGIAAAVVIHSISVVLLSSESRFSR